MTDCDSRYCDEWWTTITWDNKTCDMCTKCGLEGKIKVFEIKKPKSLSKKEPEYIDFKHESKSNWFSDYEL